LAPEIEIEPSEAIAVWSLLKETAASWSNHKAARLGAALAYYSIFSLGPLIVIAVAIAGLTFREEAVRGEVGTHLQSLLGGTGAQAVNAMLVGASKPMEGTLATVLGFGALVFAAVGVVVQLKDALNTVWEVDPPKGSGVWYFVRTYMVSLAAVLSLGFLLLVSLLLTTALAVGGKYFAPYVPEMAMHAVGSVVSFGMITLLFAMMFKWLPDTHVACDRQVPEEAALYDLGADAGTWLSARGDMGALATRRSPQWADGANTWSSRRKRRLALARAFLFGRCSQL
jgi:membrane protein